MTKFSQAICPTHSGVSIWYLSYKVGIMYHGVRVRRLSQNATQRSCLRGVTCPSFPGLRQPEAPTPPLRYVVVVVVVVYLCFGHDLLLLLLLLLEGAQTFGFQGPVTASYNIMTTVCR